MRRKVNAHRATHEKHQQICFIPLNNRSGTSYAKDNSKRQLLKPNEETRIAFDKTRFVSKQISKGSRLAIILNVNKHPYEEINYGTGKAVSDETIADAKEPLQIKWFVDSYIKLPVWVDKK